MGTGIEGMVNRREEDGNWDRGGGKEERREWELGKRGWQI